MRRKGFTLIELLVVIAIIGILAGMLFPVFARAREAARKIQCLSNVKNIAMAFQMYLVDYDKFYNLEADPAAIDYVVNTLKGGCQTDCAPTAYNPYLRAPVILDEYIKNRDVWRCPSAKYQSSTHGFTINPCLPDWLTALKRETDAGYCHAPGEGGYPVGWGGAVTDSGVQGACTNDAGGPSAFQQSIGVPCALRGQSLSAVRDVSKTVVCGDAGLSLESMYSSDYAYPDIVIPRWGLNTTGCGGHSGSGNCANQSSCGDPTTAAACEPLALCYGGDMRVVKDPTYRKTFARHLGGDNLGFADGHAKWMPGDQILLGGMDHTNNGIHPQVYYGLCVCTNLTATNRHNRPDVESTDPSRSLY